MTDDQKKAKAAMWQLLWDLGKGMNPYDLPPDPSPRVFVPAESPDEAIAQLVGTSTAPENQ